MAADLRSRLLAPLAVAALTASVAAAKSPPIDCGKASTPVDRAICASPADTALDGEIAALYDRGLAELPERERRAFAQSQVSFVHEREATCKDAAERSAHPGPTVIECVRARMQTRLRWLRRTVDRGRLADR